MKNKSTVVVLILFGFCLISALFVFLFSLSDMEFTVRDHVALVEVEGTIEDGRDVVRQLKKYKDDASVVAVVLRIESPGGGITPSQEIFEMVRQVRESGKPVVASMGSVAASGGYYIACPADTIVANPGTITGSIGVIIQYPNVDGLLDKIGIRFTTLKAGKFKDALSPYREMTREESDFLQSFVFDAYEQFIHAVASERNLDTARLAEWAEGKVFTGAQAHRLGLVDVLGTYDDAIQLAWTMAGQTGEPNVTRERKRRPSFFELLFEEDAEKAGRALLPSFRSYPVVSYKYGF